MSPSARNFLLAVLLAAGPVATYANVGDDINQLRARYGTAEAVGNQALFQHDGFSICVYFDGSHSGMEVFVRDGSKPGKTDFTEDDIKQILAAQGDGQIWNSVQVSSGKRTWMRADNKLIARFSEGDTPGDKYLTIMVNAK
ncbi:MAG TPA: hypothetical protein VL981_14540 [Candidatus Methylacidiphilales bacterium]|nr:hypothetical protein [Candidatus Methylacidiphilales bacterium]